jgi:hypothetical protein
MVGNVAWTYLLVFLMAFGVISILRAEETPMEKAETVKNEAVDSTKKIYGASKDKVCEMVNGKMECLEKKLKNRARNLSDRSKTKMKQLKNKAD